MSDLHTDMWRVLLSAEGKPSSSYLTRATDGRDDEKTHDKEYISIFA